MNLVWQLYFCFASVMFTIFTVGTSVSSGVTLVLTGELNHFGNVCNTTNTTALDAFQETYTNIWLASILVFVASFFAGLVLGCGSLIAIGSPYIHLFAVVPLVTLGFSMVVLSTYSADQIINQFKTGTSECIKHENKIRSFLWVVTYNWCLYGLYMFYQYTVPAVIAMVLGIRLLVGTSPYFIKNQVDQGYGAI